MSYFLVFLAVALLGAVAWFATGTRRRGRAGSVHDVILDDALGEPVANLPPVLLPEAVAPADVDKVRFSLGLRGYRMDQVDQVLDRLRDQLAARDAEIARLRQLQPDEDSVREAPPAAAPAPKDILEH
ncbi:DivIVA domain-containing protein [Pseudarthrobacter sp. J75]|uniref:DivIVA domain-containing protein n=1 Tax=unclassified Pseudarthrobacter TaxID=2647000 RepID=UPI002E804D1D|nr:MULTISPECIES: DivIVA domain-containing protein [unclassified Pseudarthrobacter]MEE2521294.1 DivIVA domain-containing protein [Pseudarthrobacter sp. J47]MEE2528526.1 DivIVA domain-containing protein [Pseudarthrobacter sp. J75]